MHDHARCESDSVELRMLGDLEHTSNRDYATEMRAAREGQITVHEKYSLPGTALDAHVSRRVQHGKVICAGRLGAEQP